MHGYQTTFAIGKSTCQQTAAIQSPELLPQGRVISPTLFNPLYGLGKGLSQLVEISLYADDTYIWSSGHNRRMLLSRLREKSSPMQRFLQHEH